MTVEDSNCLLSFHVNGVFALNSGLNGALIVINLLYCDTWFTNQSHAVISAMYFDRGNDTTDVFKVHKEEFNDACVQQAN